MAARADLSTRHVSFLETGRSNPSRESVLALSRALDLPLRDRNTLLRAAGFTAAYPERDLLAEDSHVRSLFEFLLRRHEPFPAFVIDHAWTVEMHNRAAAGMLAWLLDGDLPGGAGPKANGDAGATDGARGFSRLAGCNQLRLLSFLMTVAAPREVGLQEIRVETFLPADEESAELLDGLAAA